MQEISVAQAISTINTAIEQLRLTKPEHVRLQLCMDVIRAAALPKPRVEEKKPEEKKIEKPIDNTAEKALS